MGPEIFLKVGVRIPFSMRGISIFLAAGKQTFLEGGG